MNVDIKSKEQLKKFEPSVNNEGLSLVIDYKDYSSEDVLNIYDKAKEIISKGIKLSIIIQADGRNFTDEELSIFIALEKELKKDDVPLYFDGGIKETYTLEELIKADKKMDAIIDKINKSNLSPLEKYIYIYNFLTRKKYHFDDREKSGEDKEKYIHLSRDIISVMNSDYIVCQGYAELNAYLCRNVGIECLTNDLFIVDSDGPEAHINNTVLLKDEKYGIDGVFYSDPTWDNNPDEREYCFTLLPMSDVNKVKIAIRIVNPNILFIPYAPGIFAYIEGTQGTDIVYPGRNEKGELCYEFHPLAEKLNIKAELEKRMELAMDIFKYNFKKISEVIQKFKENNIPSSVYQKLSDSKVSTSLPFFLAVTLLGNNEKAFNRGMSTLLKELENEEFEVFDSKLYMFDKVHNKNIFDVYETLNEIENLNPSEFDMSFLEFYDKVNSLLLARSEKEYDRDDYQNNYLHYEMLLYILYETILSMQRMLVHIYFQKEVFKKHNIFAQIDPVSFKSALKEVFMFEGNSEQEAEIKAVDALKKTNKLNKNVYQPNAYSYSWLENIK